MSIVHSWFENGFIAHVILALMLAEAAVLIVWHRATGSGIAPAQLLANLAAGAFLILALGSALAGEPWAATAGWLAAGLAAHIADLAMRWNVHR